MIYQKIRDRTSEETKAKVRKKMDEPFSPFGSILPEEWWYWDVSNWTEKEFLWNAAGEAWNLDEYTDSGYIAMKRMIFALVDPNKECKTIDEFVGRLKELYEHRKNS